MVVVDERVQNSDGDWIELSEERWGHIISRHPELAPFRDQIIDVLRRPARRLSGRHSGEEWYYGPGGPSRWLKVVVHWQDALGVVVTAFARRRMP